MHGLQCVPEEIQVRVEAGRQCLNISGCDGLCVTFIEYSQLTVSVYIGMNVPLAQGTPF